MKPIFLFILAGCLFCAGCAAEKDTTSEAARETRAGLTDSGLEDQVETNLDSDPALKTADLSVDADAERNLVILSGTVDSELHRTRAVELARAAHDGITVENKIEVRPPEVSRTDYTPELARQEVERARAHKETVGDSVDDAWIHAKIVAQLIGDPDTPEREMNVDVRNNVVTLRGAVDTMEQKQDAERIAQQTDGVKRVINQLKVDPKPGE